MSIPIPMDMKMHTVKCEECGKTILGVSEKEVNAWLEQHKHYAHEKGENNVGKKD